MPIRSTESPGKGAGDGDSASGRFTSLARKLVRVPRGEVEAEQKRYLEEKATHPGRAEPKSKKSDPRRPEKESAG